jgi:S-adenosylhomocysteine hydrolase
MLKENINKLDRELKESFDSVSINDFEEKSKFYFDIIAEKNIDKKNIAVRVFVEKKELEKPLVTWRYLSNTNDELSYQVECVSKIDTLSKDIQNIVVKKKLDETYLESLSTIEVAEEKVIVDDRTDLVKMMEEFGVQHLETHQVVEDHVWTNLCYFKHNLRNSDKQRVEMALESAGFKFIWNDDKLLVKYYI